MSRRRRWIWLFVVFAASRLSRRDGVRMGIIHFQIARQGQSLLLLVHALQLAQYLKCRNAESVPTPCSDARLDPKPHEV